MILIAIVIRYNEEQNCFWLNNICIRIAASHCGSQEAESSNSFFFLAASDMHTEAKLQEFCRCWIRCKSWKASPPNPSPKRRKKLFMTWTVKLQIRHKPFCASRLHQESWTFHLMLTILVTFWHVHFYRSFFFLIFLHLSLNILECSAGFLSVYM